MERFVGWLELPNVVEKTWPCSGAPGGKGSKKATNA